MTSFSRASTGGHLFLVHGRLESVVHDAAVVPTSGAFGVRSYWKPVLGGTRAGHKPNGWSGHTDFDQSPKDTSIWFLNSVVSGYDEIDVLVDRVVRLLSAIRTNQLEKISTTELTVEKGRSLPLVALPVVGIQGAGLGGRRGEVVRKLIGAVQAWTAENDVDVALVTPESSVHGAAQRVRTAHQSWPLTTSELAHARRLGKLARGGRLALFFGAGVSKPAGLPTWNELLAILAGDAGIVGTQEMEGLTPLDQAQLIGLRHPNLGRAVSREVGSHNRPSLAHALLAALGCREAVTTNYDALYEEAVRAAGRDVASVLPHDEVGQSSRWILKMHGDVHDPSSIVLTRRDYVRYDALTKPSGAVLQSLLLTRHVLVVGTSMTDDNVVRLAYEVADYRSNAGRKTQYGTLLDVHQRKAMSDLWKGQLYWLSMRSDSFVERCRDLEIFLDAVSAHAASDASWLLDERFANLLGDDAALATEVRELYRRIPKGKDTAWSPLREQLKEFGAEG